MIPYLLIPPTNPWGGVMGRWDVKRKATHLIAGDLSLTALGFWVGLLVVEAKGRGFLTDRGVAGGLVTLCDVLNLPGFFEGFDHARER